MTRLREIKRIRRRERRRGFTLAELLAVMLIVIILMGIAVGSFFGMGRGARMRGAVANFNTILSLTRQYAITKTAPLDLVLINPSDGVYGYYVRHSGGIRFRTTQYLPPGMRFIEVRQRPESGDWIVVDDFTGEGFSITFRPDGSLVNVLDDLAIVIRDEADLDRPDPVPPVVFYINGLTGLAQVAGD